MSGPPERGSMVRQCDRSSSQAGHGHSRRAHDFSHRTPLNFLAVFSTAMNCPSVLLRLVAVPVSWFLSCVRFFTAPLPALSPIGLLTAMTALARVFLLMHRHDRHFVARFV